MSNTLPKHKKILVTGGLGFIGANFIPYYLETHPNYMIINLDKVTYAADYSNLIPVEKHPRYKFIMGDICDSKLVKQIFEEYDIHGVIHFAAESHVDNSIDRPQVFLETNVMGTFTLLDIARTTWMDKPFQYKEEYKNSRFHHISTDEVYGTLGDTGYFTETTPYAPNSPYSASKASSDMIVRSYHHTYGMNVVTTNCSNNYGPMQHQEKLIPTVIRKALSLEHIPIYGDGKNVRDWLYVLDHCKGVDLVFHKGKSGHTYNIGGKNEMTNIEIATRICDILDELVPNNRINSYRNLIQYVSDRPGHDKRYAIDATKIENELGWFPDESFDSSLNKTVRWYVDKYKSG